MQPNYLGLEAFVAIADHGSFKRAADSLNLSQTALSHRLRKIEEDVGAPLLIRSSREVSLTASGHGLLPDARRLMKELQQVYDAVRRESRWTRRRLSFACLPTVANSVLPKVLDAFGRDHPEIAFEIMDVPVARIAELVRSGTAEFGLTIVSAELSDLRVRALLEEEYSLLVPAHHPLAAAGVVTRPDLVGATMVRISTQSKNRQLVDIALGAFCDRMEWRYEVQAGATAMQFVAQGAALTILPNSAISMAPPSLVAVPFGDIRLSRTLGIVTRRAVPLSDSATSLLSVIETGMEALGDRLQPVSATAHATRPD